MTPDHAAPILTPEDHAHFLEQGYVVLKRAVPPDVVAAAVAFLEGGDHQGTPGAADYRAARGQSVEACMTDTIQDALAELFGPANPHARARHGDDMPRPFRPQGEWPAPRAHVDDDYPTFMPAGWAVGVFVFLTPVRPQGGAFVVFPGSPRRYQQALSATPSAITSLARDPALAGDWQEFLAEPGDALLFHHLLGHSGSDNVRDPRTRHALLSRWHPQGRLVPGDKPFGAMSTVEKASSVRFLRDTFGATFQFPAPPPGDAAALRGGFAPGDGLAAHDLLHFGGRTHLFFVDGGQPAAVQRAWTRDLADWQPAQALPPFPEAIHSLSLFARGADVLLLASGAGGTHLRLSHDLETWEDLPTAPDSRAASGHFNTPFGSKVAHGQVLFSVPADAPGQIRCRWSRTWAETAASENPVPVAAAPPGGAFAGLTVAPTFGEQRFALVADVRQADSEETRPFYAVSGDSARYDGPLRPLPFDAPSAPQGLRVYARARDYWLVTYRRPEAGQGRLFWGAVDWQAAPRLEEIRTADALRGALAAVGMA